VRGSDLVARLGGDEFAVLLAGLSDGKAAEVIADKVLVAAARPFCIDALSVAVSASIGVAVQCQAEGDWRELVARADRLLYQAKAAGRGRRCTQAETALTAN